MLFNWTVRASLLLFLGLISRISGGDLGFYGEIHGHQIKGPESYLSRRQPPFREQKERDPHGPSSSIDYLLTQDSPQKADTHSKSGYGAPPYKTTADTHSKSGYGAPPYKTTSDTHSMSGYGAPPYKTEDDTHSESGYGAPPYKTAPTYKVQPIGYGPQSGSAEGNTHGYASFPSTSYSTYQPTQINKSNASPYGFSQSQKKPVIPDYEPYEEPKNIGYELFEEYEEYSPSSSFNHHPREEETGPSGFQDYSGFNDYPSPHIEVKPRPVIQSSSSPGITYGHSSPSVGKEDHSRENEEPSYLRVEYGYGTSDSQVKYSYHQGYKNNNHHQK